MFLSRIHSPFLFNLMGDPTSGSRDGDISLGGGGKGTLSVEGGEPAGGRQQQQDDKGGQQQQQQEHAGGQQQKEEFKWDLNTFMSSLGTKFTDPNDERLSQFKPVKEFAGKVLDHNQKLEAEKATLSKELETIRAEYAKVQAAGGKGSQQPEDVVKLQAQLQQISTEYETTKTKLAEIEAKTKIEGHPEFKRRYEGGQAALLAEAKATAEAVKLPEETLNTIFSARGELAIRKAVKAAGIEDADAAAIIETKAREWDKLEAEKETLLSGKTKKPTDILAEFEKLQADMGVAVGQKFVQNLSGQLIAASNGTIDRLKDTHALIATPQGQALVEELQLTLQQGHIPKAEEVVDNAVLARIAPVWQKMATDFHAENVALKAQIAKLTGELGSASPGGESDPGAGGATRLPANNSLEGYTREGDIVLGKR